MIAFRLVIVDDDLDDRNLLRSAFEEGGSEPVLAVDSASALLHYLQNVEEERDLPRLIITDVNMPGMDGFELLKRLKLTPRYAHLPIVVWSTSNDTKEMSRALHLGAASYVVKPLRLSDYQALVHRMLPFAIAL